MRAAVVERPFPREKLALEPFWPTRASLLLRSYHHRGLRLPALLPLDAFLFLSLLLPLLLLLLLLLLR